MKSITEKKKYDEKIRFAILGLLTKNIRTFKEELKMPDEPEDIKKIRTSWLRCFGAAEYLEMCSQCGGECCLVPKIPLTNIEILYMITYEKFMLPEINWEIHKRELNNEMEDDSSSCLFLGDNGCVLGDYRPGRCIFHLCEKTKDYGSILRKLKKAEALYKKSLEKWSDTVRSLNMKRLPENKKAKLENFLSLNCAANNYGYLKQ
ncbi:hypothetical protein ACFLUV_05850 [Elusimicrobiota bacterium]